MSNKDVRQRWSLTLAARGAAVVAMVALLIVPPASGQPPSSFPAIDVRVPAAPRPFSAGGQKHLVYELHVTNLSARQTTLDAVEVRDGMAPAAPPLLRLEGTTLADALRRIGSPPDDANRRVLLGGQSAVVFVWVALNAAAAVPATLVHRFSVRVEGEPSTIDGVEVRIVRQVPIVIGPPLRGDHWLAANGPDNGSDHRRTLLALSGEGRIAQRFAIDWVRLYGDGRTWKGDPTKNSSYRAYGADVVAVADGTVSDIRDGIPENVPDPMARAVPITPGTLVGNYVLLGIGGSAFAVYAHLQPGSLTVKKGERVRRGQVLGRLGNSGNSTEPHLHFHVADRPSAIDSEGIPYALESFDLEASPDQVTPAIIPVGQSLGIDAAALAKWISAAPHRRQSEMPLTNAIVKFPGPLKYPAHTRR